MTRERLRVIAQVKPLKILGFTPPEQQAYLRMKSHTLHQRLAELLGYVNNCQSMSRANSLVVDDETTQNMKMQGEAYLREAAYASDLIVAMENVTWMIGHGGQATAVSDAVKLATETDKFLHYQVDLTEFASSHEHEDTM
jgi:hypothetical protein